MTESPIVRLKGLHKRFGKVSAVDGVDLEIRAGEVVALLGPNGAGKSTTIDLMLGLSRPSSGTAELFGGAPREAIVAGRVGAMLQGGALLPTTTVRESVALVAAAHRHPLPVAEAMRRARVTDIAGRRVAKLSGGELQRARFAVAIVSDPELLVLDEPTAAMDVEARHGFWSSMRELTETGRTVLFATHYLDEADAFADRVVIVNRGRVVADGTPAQVKSIVQGRTLSFTAPAVPSEQELLALPGVSGANAVSVRNGRVTVRTGDSDAALRAVLQRWPSASELELVPNSMDDAFLALTADGSAESAHDEPDPATATTEEVAR